MTTEHPEDTASKPEGLLTRSWHAILSPFSSAALRQLPNTSQRKRDRETRTDRIPEGEGDVVVHDFNNNNNNADTRGNVEYGPASAVPLSVRVPKKIPTPIKVEGKVWFANERTWIAYVNVGVLVGTLALALFNASEDAIARNFAYIYALISVGVLVYGWVVYQKRITMIRKRDPGHFDQIAGPVIIATFLFFAVLANFIIRLREVRRRGAPLPRD
ncbi:uncharacterized protein FOMMEDRAFT_102494 [Fomitiporia mediterranea MF3/22]|uniref:uncharacterized protein n=1 Tax=Fomitiporia mediterranea (strain MF3/22) TaxID=694068 RepID=UPI0004407465|nr:uncharacterized protein FOMMEDRAFT_102494 [Fomitiporia mediterranea MF3/22]EJD06644.1 hypothetical protein FOMMEDRAFT_102494 [Fomitiporia mediterranea MF3/22]